MSTEKTRTVVHGDFTLERTYPADLARVWAAFANEKSKSQWFGMPDSPGYSLDFTVGGHEINKGEHEGTVYTYDAIFMDIVECNRIITTYEMYMNDQRISVSYAAYEFFAEGAEGAEQGGLTGEGQAREVYFEEFGVAAAVFGAVEDGVEVVEHVFRAEGGGQVAFAVGQVAEAESLGERLHEGGREVGAASVGRVLRYVLVK